MNFNFKTKPQKGLTLNQEKKKSIDQKSPSLVDGKLNKYQINFVGEFRSIDEPNAWFTNKYSDKDIPLLNQIKHLLKISGKPISVNKIPITLTENRDTYLFNQKTNADLIKTARFNKVCNAYKIKDKEKKELLKFPYRTEFGLKGALRLICYKNDNIINVVFLDIHHLLATKLNDGVDYDMKAGYCGLCMSRLC